MCVRGEQSYSTVGRSLCDRYAGWEKDVESPFPGLDPRRSLGSHTILFVSQKNQVTHLLVTRRWTASTPSGAPKNTPPALPEMPPPLVL